MEINQVEEILTKEYFGAFGVFENNQSSHGYFFSNYSF